MSVRNRIIGIIINSEAIIASLFGLLIIRSVVRCEALRV